MYQVRTTHLVYLLLKATGRAVVVVVALLRRVCPAGIKRVALESEGCVGVVGDRSYRPGTDS